MCWLRDGKQINKEAYNNLICYIKVVLPIHLQWFCHNYIFNLGMEVVGQTFWGWSYRPTQIWIRRLL